MDRELLMKAGSRITITICFTLFGLIGQITGYGLGKMLF